MIAIVDYGAGNLRSVVNAINRLGYQSQIISAPDEVLAAQAVILPGVGAAADTMTNLQSLGLVSPIRRFIDEERPFLGVCIGLQILFSGTGMHGGTIYLRGNIEDYQLGKEVGIADLEDTDDQILRQCVGEFAAHFGYQTETILKHKFIKLFPRWLRPYGRLYAY